MPSRTIRIRIGAAALSISAVLGVGCQIEPHGGRASLRANAIEPDAGSRVALSAVLARSDLIGPAPAPVAAAPRP